MADTLVKKPKLIVGTQAQVEAEMGDNDIGFATDIKFYTAKEVDDLLSDLGGGASLPILMAMWSDHIINDMSWLRADTFSWQSGDVYKAAYEHLVGEFNSGKKYYAWAGLELALTFYTEREVPLAGDILYTTGLTEDEWTEYGVLVSDYDGSGYLYVSSQRLDVMRSENKDIVRGSSDTIGDITITYCLAEDGHKICLPDQESNLSALYEQTGSADYYLLDTENKQFKLPRKQKRKLIQAVKNDDGTWYNLYSDGWVEQGGTASSGSSSVVFPVAFSGTTYYFNADLESGGTGTTLHAISSGYTTTGCTVKEGQSGVAQRALTANAKWFACGYTAESAYASAGMRLEYYYVGNFEQSAIEQTAGLNAELFNGKADVDLNNINPSNSAKATIISYGIPDYTSSTSISGNEFVAPCAGLVLFEVGATVQNGAGGSITVNGVDVDYMSTTSCTVVTRKFAWVDEDDVVVFTNGAQGNSKIFFPLKGTK